MATLTALKRKDAFARPVNLGELCSVLRLSDNSETRAQISFTREDGQCFYLNLSKSDAVRLLGALAATGVGLFDDIQSDAGIR